MKLIRFQEKSDFGASAKLSKTDKPEDYDSDDYNSDDDGNSFAALAGL